MTAPESLATQTDLLVRIKTWMESVGEIVYAGGGMPPVNTMNGLHREIVAALSNPAPAAGADKPQQHSSVDLAAPSGQVPSAFTGQAQSANAPGAEGSAKWEPPQGALRVYLHRHPEAEGGWWVACGEPSTGILCAHPSDPRLCMQDVVNAWEFLAKNSPQQVPPFPEQPAAAPGCTYSSCGCEIVCASLSHLSAPPAGGSAK